MVKSNRFLVTTVSIHYLMIHNLKRLSNYKNSMLIVHINTMVPLLDTYSSGIKYKQFYKIVILRSCSGNNEIVIIRFLIQVVDVFSAVSDMKQLFLPTWLTYNWTVFLRT